MTQQGPAARSRRGWLRPALSVAVSLALLGGLAWRLDLAAIGGLLSSVSPAWLLVAALLGPPQIVLGGLRWARVSRALGLPLETGEAVAEYGVSTALNQLLPGGIAGDAVRVVRQRHHGAVRATVAAVVDRALGLVVLTLVACGGLGLWAWQGPPPPSSLVVGVCGLAVVGGGVAASPAGRPLRRALAADGLWLIAASVALVLSFVAGFAAASLAVGLTPSWGLLGVVPLVLLAMAIPLSFAGWGPRELSAGWLWPMLGASPEEGVAVAAAYGLSVLLGALPGLWGLRRRPGISGGS